MQNGDSAPLEHWKGKKNMQNKNYDGVSRSHIGEGFLYAAVICTLIATPKCY